MQLKLQLETQTWRNSETRWGETD